MNPASNFHQTLLEFCNDQCRDTCCSAYAHCSSTCPENYQEDDLHVHFPNCRLRINDERRKQCALHERTFRQAILKEANKENRRWRADIVCNHKRRNATFLGSKLRVKPRRSLPSLI